MTWTVTTRYAGPTNTRSGRIIATGPALTSDDARDNRYTRATEPYNHDLGGGIEQHRPAAAAVVAKLRDAGWNVRLGAGGTLPREDGHVFLLEYTP